MADKAKAEKLNPHDLQSFLGRADEGPVAMLNLLKFVPDTGAARYREYAQAVAPLLAKQDAKLIYSGSAGALLLGADAERWDHVLIMQYPTRRALMNMTTSSEYQAIAHLRTEALERSVLLETEPSSFG